MPKVTNMNSEKMNIIKTVQVAINAIGKGEVNSRPKRYTCRFMKEGLTSYPDANKGKAIWYLPRSVMTNMQKSFIGCPIVVEKDHNDISSPDVFQDVAVGVVSEVWTDAEGWDNSAFIVWDKDTKELIEKQGYNVSCAYKPLNSKGGGILNAVKYDYEVTEGEYTHMAIVAAPRQTGAQIFLNKFDKNNQNVIIFSMNWKGKESIMKFWPMGKVKLNSAEPIDKAKVESFAVKKLENGYMLSIGMKQEDEKYIPPVELAFEDTSKLTSKIEEIFGATEEVKKNTAAAINAAEEDAKKKEEEEKTAKEKEAKEKETKENSSEVDPEKAIIEGPDGEQIPLKELLVTWEAEQAEIKKKEELEKEKLTLESEYNGVKVSEMYDVYKKNKGANKNSAEEEEKAKAEAEEKARKEKETFNKLNSARDTEQDPPTIGKIYTPEERVELAAKSGQY